MTIITDKVPVKGGADFTFMCSKIPFAVSCTKNLPHGAYNYIDLDLINSMNIPLLNIKVTRMSILGREVRAVGSISQTVQCVHKGKVQGTVHLEAKVVRNLFSLFNVDCIASKKTFTRLTGNGPPEPLDLPDDDDEEEKPPIIKLDGDEEDEKKPEKIAEKDDDNHQDVPAEPDPPDVVKEDIPWDPRHRNTKPAQDEEDDDNSNDEEEDEDTVAAAHEYGYRSPPRSRAPDVLDPSMRNRPLDEYAAEHGHYYLPPLWEVMDLSDKVFCKVCYMAKQKREVFYSHYTLDLSCPSLSDVDKRILMARAMSGDL